MQLTAWVLSFPRCRIASIQFQGPILRRYLLMRFVLGAVVWGVARDLYHVR